MPITDLLERNSKLYGDEIALVEINPEVQEPRRVSWQEYELIQSTSSVPYRREITWSIFDELPTCCWAGASTRGRRWPSC